LGLHFRQIFAMLSQLFTPRKHVKGKAVSRIAACLLFLAILFFPSTALSGETSPSPKPEKPEPPVSEPASKTDKPIAPAKLELSLDQAVRIAVRHNQKILIGKLGVDIAQEAIELPKAEFDEYFSTIATLGQDRAPNAYAIAAKEAQKKYGNNASLVMGIDPSFLEFLGPGGVVSQSESFNLTLSLTQKFTTGTSYTLAAGSMRRQTESRMDPFNPGYYPYTSITLTQPLLKGFGTDYNRTYIELAKYGHKIAKEQLRWTGIQTIAETEKAYWNLILTRETLAVQMRSLDRAKELLRRTRERIRVGEAAKIDELQPEATVADIEAKIVRAKNLIKTARDWLLLVMQPSVSNRDWDLDIIPTTKPYDNTPVASIEECLETALGNRPDLTMAELSLKSKLLDEAKKRKDRLPQLDISGSMQWNGIDSNFGNARDRLGTGRFYDWEFSLTFIWPFRLRAEKAAYRRARLETSKAREEKTGLKHLLIFEVRNAHRNVKTAREQIRARGKSVKAAEEALAAEQVRQREGLSTNFEVLAAQEFLALAELGLIQARIDLQIALAELKHAEGINLEAYGIELQKSDKLKK